jgi:hypothetical protein
VRPPDSSGKDAVLCAWSLLLLVQTSTRVCGWQRQPVDDAIDQAVGDIDNFILANSSEHPSREALDKTKQLLAEGALREFEGILHNPRALHEACNVPGGLPDTIRRFTSPGRLAHYTSDLLSIPREPRWNPCL